MWHLIFGNSSPAGIYAFYAEHIKSFSVNECDVETETRGLIKNNNNNNNLYGLQITD